jgi:hypothetical protein
MSQLAALVGSLKRFVAPPGQFDTYFPDASDLDLTEALADGWAEARRFGLFGSADLDLDDYTVTPDISIEQGSVVVLFTGARILRTQIANRKSHVRYEAPGVVSEQDYASQVLVELLKQYEAEKQQVITLSTNYGVASAVYMADASVARSIASYDLNWLHGRSDYHDPVGGLL